MKKHYIFVESGAKIRFDFSKIFDGRQYALYLIVEEKLFETLSTGAIFSFQKIVKCPASDFNPSKLAEIVEKIMSYPYQMYR